MNYFILDKEVKLRMRLDILYTGVPIYLLGTYLSVYISYFQSDDPNMKTSQAITKFLPLMIGYFALSVPSGLSLYW